MRQPRRTDAFTLVELLVVIAIISVLAGFLMPVLVNARATAKDVRCVGNMRSLGNALMLYLTANENFIPACGPEDEDDEVYQTWYRAFLPFVERWDIFECPAKATSMRDVPEELLHGQPVMDTEFHTVNYGMNCQLSGDDPDDDLMGRAIQMDCIVSPSQVLFLADGARFSGGGPSDSIAEYEELPDSIVDGALYFADEIQPDMATASPRHRGHTTCLFLDGHVDSVATNRIFAVQRGHAGCFYDAALVE